MRNILTLSIMSFGITMAIFYDGIIKGYTLQTLALYRKSELGYYKIYPKNFYINREDSEKTDYLMNERNILSNLSGLKISQRLNFQGTLINEDISIPINLLGVNKLNEEEVFQRTKDLIKGNFLKNEKELVIGSGIAKELNLDLGDEITIVSRTVEKSINAYDMVVGGIIKTDNTILNKNTVFISLDFAKNMLLTDEINEVVIGQKYNFEGEEFSAYDVISLEEDLRDLIDLMIIKSKGATTSMNFILFLAGVGIANTMLMAMLERQKEIGIMLANGMDTGDIKKLFLFEGFILGLLGALIGLCLGFIAVYLSSKYGIPLPSDFYENMDLNLVIPTRMYGVINGGTYIKYAILGIIISTFASLYAANKGSKIEALDVLSD